MEGTSAGFGFSRAVREWCFVQLPLLDVAKFRKEAKARGLSDLGLFDRDPWETLDRQELLVPVAYARHGMWHYDVLGCLADGDLAVREEVGYRPWPETGLRLLLLSLDEERLPLSDKAAQRLLIEVCHRQSAKAHVRHRPSIPERVVQRLRREDERRLEAIGWVRSVAAAL